MNQSGRSMVEMLGVLAIVGVLSVGGLAGYSQAMFKYKLNKQAEQLNTIFNAVSRLAPSFPNAEQNQMLTPYFIQMGEFPEDMVHNDGIYDAFGINMYIRWQNRKLVAYFYMPLDKKSAQALEICRNFIMTAKENSASIENITFVGSYGQEGAVSKAIFGDKKCTNNNTCLKTISLNAIHTYCTSIIDKQNVHVKIFWDTAA